MAEILHQLIGSYPIIYSVLYIQGGAGFCPSTVHHNICIPDTWELEKLPLFCKKKPCSGALNGGERGLGGNSI